ncbi:MAG: adenosylcobalamin-dependent ribonucleoside-diphosphate reductase [Phycisphaerae bacterium]|nr:adenosylcobalamin-dependent ribonucleoside-diphosphate reductase [Phycisphaerae bacterium]
MNAELGELSDNAHLTLEARYLRRDASGRIVETPRDMFERVARSVARAEQRYADSAATVDYWRGRFAEQMMRGRFLPNSPTLMNAGRRLGMLSACFVLPVPDSIEGIFESVKNAARIQQAGGGTGFSFDLLRPTGDTISTSGGRTSGPISFWRVFSEATHAIQQGAFRRGANMGMMSLNHPDVLKFITAKNAPGRFENFNISVKVTEKQWRLLQEQPDDAHVVTNPRTGRSYHLPRWLAGADYALDDLRPVADGGTECLTRREVWEMLTAAAWNTAEPGVCFIDRVNADNPTPRLGRIEATNPCGEQPLLDYEACNLASIDVAKFIRSGALDEAAFRATVRLGVRFCDDVIDVNNYITDAIAERCHGNRKIGLGVMGLADAMYEFDIRYDSDEGLAFARRVADVLTDEAFNASETLAGERGCFPNYSGSVWDERGREMRNAAVTTIAPTGTLSILAGCTGGIEPAYALAFDRHVLQGRKLREVNRPLKRYAERRGLWSESVAARLAEGAALSELPGFTADDAARFVTAHDVSPEWHVRMQATFQEYIDGAISKTINMPRDATVTDVREVYALAHHLGCKGITVYRDGCREGQPMAAGRKGRCPRCGGPIADEAACSRCPRCGGTLCP